MCTAVSLSNRNHYFGRNLDLEYSYIEQVVITPRNYPFIFRHQKSLTRHYALIGMAYICDDYPLYYDATNEKGLSMAGLNFPANAHYYPLQKAADNIAPFELIPWLLGQCATVAQARTLLEKINILAEPFNQDLPLSPLHWIIADRTESIVLESTKKGLFVSDNPVGVLTNSPTFDMQLFHLNNYMNLSQETPENNFSEELNLAPYSNGMGALGMPGDWSSQSRFVKAAFLRMNSVCSDTEDDCISQFFHILDSVAHPRGCVAMENDAKEMQYEITIYSSCCNTDAGIYYYKTYNNNQISAVHMKKENLVGTQLISYPLLDTQQVHWQN